jgi:hypothetical protein
MKWISVAANKETGSQIYFEVEGADAEDALANAMQVVHDSYPGYVVNDVVQTEEFITRLDTADDQFINNRVIH